MISDHAHLVYSFRPFGAMRLLPSVSGVFPSLPLLLLDLPWTRSNRRTAATATTPLRFRFRCRLRLPARTGCIVRSLFVLRILLLLFVLFPSLYQSPTPPLLASMSTSS